MLQMSGSHVGQYLTLASYGTDRTENIIILFGVIVA
jgi:hypothetical protein